MVDRRERQHGDGTPADIHRQMLEQGIEQSIDAVVAIDAHNRVSHFNAAAERLWGYSREQVLGRNVSMLVPPELHGQHDGYIDNNRRTGLNKIVGTSREVPVIRQDGERRWALMSISRIEVSDLVLYSAVLRDVTEQRHMREELRLLSLATHETGNAVIIFDERQRIRYLNRGCAKLLGWHAQTRLGEDFLDSLLRDSPLQEQAAGLRAQLEQGLQQDILLRDSNGRPLWCALVVNGIRDARGGFQHGVAVLTEITQAKMYEVLQLKVMDALLQETEPHQVLDLLCQEAHHLAPDLALAIVRRHPGHTLEVLASCGLSAELTEALERLEDGALGTLHGGQTRLWQQERPDLGLGPTLVRQIALHKDYHELLLSFQAAPAQENPFHTHLEGLCVHLARLTLERAQAQTHIRQLAFYDPLTGLPNRAQLNLHANTLLASARNTAKPLAVLFIDLDHFKQVNDSLGHAAGDDLLCAIARRLRDSLREDDTLARLSGDEFIAILGQTSSRQAADTAERLLQAISQPLAIVGQSLSPSASIGISLYPGDGEDLPSLLRHADQAMYQAKKARRGSFGFFQAELDRQARERLKLEQELHQALKDGQLQLHYQPQLELESLRVRGVEALLRWQHERLGILSPARFIPLAEECGLIIRIGHWVLNEACRQMADWRRRGIEIPNISINLSAQDFHQRDLSLILGSALQQHALCSGDMTLELTESLLIDGHPVTLENLDTLQTCGIRLAMDDFGTGYSSLGYLRRLPVRELKLDRLFVCDLEQDDEARALTQAVIHIGDSLGLDVIAEGVETPRQMQILQQQGYRFAQGYLFAPALPPEELESWLSSHKLEA
ncbi:sensor domain-containing protein [Stutzerimonas kirkiae]|uniref:sensor domain-containing protein n=1 Tax=Stutzerimonas kirkiae TaxID=2211392 RepID=UPI00103843B4|nr:EAL domain-containing protein [Stutzerimonas kirkiae]TBV06562.1 bifunctional diguanylate cyclase/phosphodiesterase [Stutzerimonas kirkiae]TBV13715.1 bifunctional diguanylate cyclase/phosphodiesterase [Stutzerimonas kirkiae]